MTDNQIINPVTSTGLLKLTQIEIDYLQSFLDANDKSDAMEGGGEAVNQYLLHRNNLGLDILIDSDGHNKIRFDLYK